MAKPRVGSARIDERDRARGGKAGDQTGREVMIQDGYISSDGWVVIRPKDLTVAAVIADTMEALCGDPLVGYDQGQRDTLWDALKGEGYDPDELDKAVETDCSAAVRLCCARAGIVVANFTTPTEAARLMATGKFIKLTAAKYTKRMDLWRRGDILVTKKTPGHTVVVTRDGTAAEYPLGGRALRVGCVGQDVEDLQGYLKALGYGHLLGTSGSGKDGVDGEYGQMTAAAVKSFEAAHKLPADGVADLVCIKAIIAAANGDQVPADGNVSDEQEADAHDVLGARVLQQGDEGPDVTELQEGILKLSGAGAVYDLGTTGDNHDGVDGEYGPKTAACVWLFQSLHKLPGTGIFDAETFIAFTAALADKLADEVTEDTVDEDVTIYPDDEYIPDTSANQRTFRPEQIAKACPFVILRARVSGKTDNTYKDRALALLMARVPHWAYDYIKTTSVKDAIAQADAMYDLCNMYGPVGYYLDVETLADGVTYAESREHITAYVTQLRKRGLADGKAIKIGEYMGTSRHDSHYKSLDGLFDTHWPATWGVNDGYLSRIPSYGDLHQYTSMFDAKGANIGIPGGRDMNRLTGRKPISFFTGRAHDGTGYHGVARITAGSANIRAGASAGSKRLGTASKGKLFERREGDVPGWIAINYRGADGFVSAELVDLITG